MNVRHLRTPMLLPVVALVAACASPPEVGQLAEKTAANTAVLGDSLSRLAASSERIANARARSLAELQRYNAEVAMRNELDFALLEKTDRADLGTYRALKAWSDKTAEIYGNATRDEATAVRATLEGRKGLAVPTAKLSEVAKTLADLAKEDSLEDRARFLRSYAGEVKEEVDARREAAAEAAQRAETAANSTASAVAGARHGDD